MRCLQRSQNSRQRAASQMPGNTGLVGASPVLCTCKYSQTGRKSMDVTLALKPKRIPFVLIIIIISNYYYNFIYYLFTTSSSTCLPSLTFCRSSLQSTGPDTREPLVGVPSAWNPRPPGPPAKFPRPFMVELRVLRS